jgi:WD40 repeat protein
VIGILSDQQEPDGGQGSKATGLQPSRLLHWLRETRCLIVLDNVETILQAGDHAGYYRDGYEDYGELMRLVGETPHQGCILITSREKSAEIAALEGVDSTTRTLQLSGSVETAIALIHDKQLQGTLEQQRGLCDRYSYNPLALKIVSTTIRDLFDGDISAFLAEDAVIFNSVRRLLEEQFRRLSDLEQAIMIWLAINRDWTDMGELADDSVPTDPKVRLLESLESLRWRGLIETQEKRYTLQPVVMEYVTQYLIEQVSAELTVGAAWNPATINHAIINRFALLKTTVKAFIRQTQERLILHPIVEQLTGQALEARQLLGDRLDQLRSHQPPIPGYAAGNLINLCRVLDLDFTGLDLSHLHIRQAYLQDIDLHQVNFTEAVCQQTVFNQPLGPVFHVAYSPDGAMLAAGQGNGQIMVWETTGYQPILTLQASTNWIMALDFSADSRFLISEGIDHSLNVWDLATGQQVNTLPGHTGLLWVINSSPVENVVISGGIDSTLRVWDLENLGDGEEPTPIHQLHGHTQQINTATFSPDGRWIVSGGADNTLRLWDRHTGAALKTWDCIAAPMSVRFSPDGVLLAIAFNDGTIHLWDWPSQQPRMTWEAHKFWVMSIRFSPCGRYLASGSADATSKIWEVSTGKLLRMASVYGSWIWAIAFSPDARYLAVSNTDHTVRLWSIPNKELFRSLQGFASWVTAIAVHPHHPLVASASEDSQVRLWHQETGELIQTLTDHDDWVMAVQFSPCGQWIASSSSDRTIRVWEVATGKLRHTLRGHHASMWSISFSPDSQRMLSGSFDRTLKLWNVETGELLHTLEGHQDWIYPACFSPTGKYIASGGIEDQIYLWEGTTGDLIRSWPNQQQSTWAIAFSPDEHLLASGGEDTTIHLWETRTGTLVKTLKGHTSSVRSVVFDPTGEHLTSSSDDHTIKLWHVPTGTLLTTLSAHTGRVNSLAITPDGKTLVSGSTDETVRLWDVASGTCRQVFRAPRPYEGMNITKVTGLTLSQRQGLLALGAVTDDD